MADKRKEAFQILLAIDGKRSFSVDNLFMLLDQIQVTGSISKAAAELEVSYRYAWGLIQDAERELAMELVVKQVGGFEGGGTHITEKGSRLLNHYQSLKQDIDTQLAGLLTPEENSEPWPVPGKGFGHDHVLLMASTIGPVETGLLDALEQAYYRETGVLVRHIAAGSGRALDIARMGRVDLVLVHAPDLEDHFMKEGFGSLKEQVMRNRFYLVGPPSDPAGLRYIKEEAGVVGLFRQIALTQHPFISRGDQSGTHMREEKIWSLTGMKPQAPWYYVSPDAIGNVGAIHLALEKKGYTLVDSASFWKAQCQGELAIYAGETGKDPLLLNLFSAIAVNREKFPHVNQVGCEALIGWLTAGPGQTIIASFGEETIGKPLFESINE